MVLTIYTRSEYRILGFIWWYTSDLLWSQDTKSQDTDMVIAGAPRDVQGSYFLFLGGIYDALVISPSRYKVLYLLSDPNDIKPTKRANAHL